MTDLNFVFIRHGESCQQAIDNKYNKYDNKNQWDKMFNILYDPQLSERGMLNSIESGENILLSNFSKKFFY